MSTHAALSGAGQQVADKFAALLRDLSAADMRPALKVQLARRFADVLFANSHAHFMQAERLLQFADVLEASTLTTTPEEPHV